ncbi:MAG: AI-2E family transporter [Ilumatobacteraceae bacterium]
MSDTVNSPPARDVQPRLHHDYAVVVSARGFAFFGFFVIGTLVAVMVVERASQVFALLGAAVTAAVIAAPFFRALSRKIPRAAAIVAVTLIGMFGTVAVLGTIAWDLDRQATGLSDSLHQAVADLPEGSSAAQTATDLELDDRIDRVFDGAAARLVVGGSNPLAVAAEVAKVVVVGVLAAFMLAGGRRVVDVGIRFARRTSIREELHRALSDSLTRAGGYLRRTIAVSVAHGIVAGLLSWTLGLPGSISIATWVAVASTIPILGGLLAWLPIVALARVNDVPLVLAIAIAVSCIVGDRLARARWVHHALRVGPLLALGGIGVGLSLIGVSGAILGLFVVSVVTALLSYDGHLRAAITDLVEDPDDRAIPAATDGAPVEEAVLAEPRGRDTYIRLRLSGRTAATAVIAVAAAVALFEIGVGTQSLIVWFTVGGFIAVGLDRPVSAMHRSWHLPRAAGTTVVLGAMVGLVSVVVVLAGPSITNSAATVARDAPEAVRSMETLPLIGRLLEQNGAPEKVEDFLATLPDRLRQSDAVERVAAAAGDGFAGAFWTISFMLAILWDGPRLVRAVRDRVPQAKRHRVVGFGRSAYTALSNVVAAAAFVAALNGTVVMLLAIALGIPLAPVLGLWAATWNFIPQIGGFVGALPLVALGFGQGPWAGLVALGVFVVYQAFENHVIQPLIGSRVVHVPPLVLLVGALFAGALAGFVGALMAGPILGVGKVALNEIRRGDDHRIEDRRATSARLQPRMPTPRRWESGAP